jgi:hypothetical protein
MLAHYFTQRPTLAFHFLKDNTVYFLSQYLPAASEEFKPCPILQQTLCFRASLFLSHLLIT